MDYIHHYGPQASTTEYGIGQDLSQCLKSCKFMKQMTTEGEDTTRPRHQLPLPLQPKSFTGDLLKAK